MTFYGEMLDVQNRLNEGGVPVSLPDAEDGFTAVMAQSDYDRFKRRVSLAHLRRVRHRDTSAVLVMNLDKQGKPDYIGPSTYAEIAMAFAFNKPVYLLGAFPAVYAEELSAWGAKSLNGRLDQLIRDHWTSCGSLPERQMHLFGLR